MRINEFAREETGEEWLRELYKVVTLRRGNMFGMITESARQLLFGNAGGAALIIGFISSGVENPAYHWAASLGLLSFVVGIIASALTMILVTWVSVKEAHSAEYGLKRFVDGEIDRTEALFTVDKQNLRAANFATASSLFSALGFVLGGLFSIVLIIVFL